jgi:2-C-methyl-D-erythritol 4-phosphate cytidylyltransferase
MTSAIIVAAGKGVRMGSDKLWAQVGGRPLVAYSWLAFDQAACIDEIILVVREETKSAFAGLAPKLKKPFRLVQGGAERQDSVWNGLEALGAGAEWVAVHDAARPCVTESIIEATLAAARECGAAVAAQPVTDTIKESSDGVTIARHLDRSRLWAVQTPQCFRVSVIRRAMVSVREQRLVVTDDTAACGLIGQEVRLVQSPTPNPKVTVASDLAWVELLLRQRGG